ncbi:hypothetical protein Y023_5679 [Burkholderia pseudomallei A79D]|nr:hypothetical protein Y023_5679 [Burkholderia pseudomallei A79D]
MTGWGEVDALGTQNFRLKQATSRTGHGYLVNSLAQPHEKFSAGADDLANWVRVPRKLTWSTSRKSFDYAL